VSDVCLAPKATNNRLRTACREGPIAAIIAYCDLLFFSLCATSSRRQSRKRFAAPLNLRPLRVIMAMGPPVVGISIFRALIGK
jgi:hypothetical protein